jgi:hypothetical protein
MRRRTRALDDVMDQHAPKKALPDLNKGALRLSSSIAPSGVFVSRKSGSRQFYLLKSDFNG